MSISKQEAAIIAQMKKNNDEFIRRLETRISELTMSHWDEGVEQPQPLRDESSSSNHAEPAPPSPSDPSPSDGELANAVFQAQQALLSAWDAAQVAGLSVQHYAADSSSPWPHVHSIQRVFTPDNARIQQEDRPEWPRDHEPAGRYGVVGDYLYTGGVTCDPHGRADIDALDIPEANPKARQAADEKRAAFRAVLEKNGYDDGYLRWLHKYEPAPYKEIMDRLTAEDPGAAS